MSRTGLRSGVSVQAGRCSAAPSSELCTAPSHSVCCSPQDLKPVIDGMDGIKISQGLGLQDFDLIRVIGRGSYAKVLLVRLKKNDQVYAMKVVKKELVHDDEVSPARPGRFLSQRSHTRTRCRFHSVDTAVVHSTCTTSCCHHLHHLCPPAERRSRTLSSHCPPSPQDPLSLDISRTGSPTVWPGVSAVIGHRVSRVRPRVSASLLFTAE